MNHPRIDVERPKRLHVKLSEDEHVKIKMVADHIGVGISDFIRPMVMRIVEREIDARGLRAALARRAAAIRPVEMMPAEMAEVG